MAWYVGIACFPGVQQADLAQVAELDLIAMGFAVRSAPHPEQASVVVPKHVKGLWGVAHIWETFDAALTASMAKRLGRNALLVKKWHTWGYGLYSKDGSIVDEFIAWPEQWAGIERDVNLSLQGNPQKLAQLLSIDLGLLLDYIKQIPRTGVPKGKKVTPGGYYDAADPLVALEFLERIGIDHCYHDHGALDAFRFAVVRG